MDSGPWIGTDSLYYPSRAFLEMDESVMQITIFHFEESSHHNICVFQYIT
jgi:hypothetical protein